MFRDLSVWSGLFPSRLWTFAPKVCLLIGFIYIGINNSLWYSEFPWVWYRFGQPAPRECSTPKDLFYKRSTSIDFAENQLSPSSFGFSPLVTSHPRLLPQTWVRSSRRFYPSFNLLMTRSPGFGFKSWDYFVSKVYGFPTPPPSRLKLCHKIWLADPLCKRYAVTLLYICMKKASTVCRLWVSVSFHSLFRVLFSFPSRY